MNFTICITSYATGKYDFWNVYDLSSYLSALKDFRKRFNQHDGDYEIQIIESDYINVKEDDLYKLFNFIDGGDSNLESLESLKILLSVMGVDESIECLENDISIQIIYSSSKENAFIEYYIENGYTAPSDDLIGYIDWESLMNDFEIESVSIYDSGCTYKNNKFVNRFIFVSKY